MERLQLPCEAVEEVQFTTKNGLPIANGYNRVVLTEKGPMVEFSESQIHLENVTIPPALQWRRKHPEALYCEFRSRDYCNVKIVEQRRAEGSFKAGMFYISPFDLVSDKYPTLIERLTKSRKN
jgi:hypothetical protein